MTAIETDLRKPPGPRARYPGQLLLGLRGDTLNFLTRTAREFGDVASFRVGPWDYFLFSHPDAVRDVLVTQADAFIKGPALRRAKDTLGDGLLTSEGDFHRRQRRLAQPAFHPQRVALYADRMVHHARQVIGQWRDGQSLDIHEQMMRLTLRIVAQTLFDAEVEDEVEQIGRAMHVTVNMFTRAMSPLAPILNRLPLPSNYRFKRSRALLLATVERFIQERRSTNMSHDDLLARMLAAKDADDGVMTDAQLRDEALTLFTAGHETTANALTFSLYLLSQNREALARLEAEVDCALAGRPPGAADVDRLPWTRAVIAESMRLYPPAWALGREPTRDVRIAGWPVPAGSVVLLSQWVVHRDARWWPDPQRFDPARFLSPDPNRPRWSYFPFGGGVRQCIGESFAWMEAILVLATIAQQWRVATRVDQSLPLRPTITLRPKHGLPAMVEKRDVAN